MGLDSYVNHLLNILVAPISAAFLFGMLLAHAKLGIKWHCVSIGSALFLSSQWNMTLPLKDIGIR